MKKVIFIILAGLLSVSYALDLDWEFLTEFEGSKNDDIVGRIHFIDERHGLAVRNNTSVFYTNDSGRTWTRGQRNNVFNNVFAPKSEVTSICLSDVNTGWVVAGDSLFKSVNGGGNWEPALAVGNDSTIKFIHFPTPLRGYFGGRGVFGYSFL